jgi:hypothetical protein
MPLELTEFTWKSTANLPEIAHEQLSGVLHPPPPHTHHRSLRLCRVATGKRVGIAPVMIMESCKDLMKT